MRIVCVLLMAAVMAVAATPATDWPAYGGDKANTRYSPLSQINIRQPGEGRNSGNVTRLVQAWAFDTRPWMAADTIVAFALP